VSKNVRLKVGLNNKVKAGTTIIGVMAHD
jgi:hypothetical protein